MFKYIVKKLIHISYWKSEWLIGFITDPTASHPYTLCQHTINTGKLAVSYYLVTLIRWPIGQYIERVSGISYGKKLILNNFN